VVVTSDVGVVIIVLCPMRVLFCGRIRRLVGPGGFNRCAQEFPTVAQRVS
jgi:hypothetical protein